MGPVSQDYWISSKIKQLKRQAFGLTLPSAHCQGVLEERGITKNCPPIHLPHSWHWGDEGWWEFCGLQFNLQDNKDVWSLGMCVGPHVAKTSLEQTPCIYTHKYINITWDRQGWQHENQHKTVPFLFIPRMAATEMWQTGICTPVTLQKPLENSCSTPQNGRSGTHWKNGYGVEKWVSGHPCLEYIFPVKQCGVEVLTVETKEIPIFNILCVSAVDFLSWN